jgi:hypothetical protein
LTLTLLPTETTVAIDYMDTVVELCSYSPDTVMTAIATIFECLPTMPARDMDVLLCGTVKFVQAMNQHGDVLELRACFLLVNLAFQATILQRVSCTLVEMLPLSMA